MWDRVRGVLVMLVVVGGGSAWACSGYVCQTEFSPVPADGAEIPANAPAVGISATVFSVESVDAGTEGRPTRPTALFDAADAAVSVMDVSSLTGRMVSATLQEGATYRIEGGGDGRCPVNSTFSVGPAQPLPTSAGTVREVEQLAQMASRGGICNASATVLIETTRLGLVPSAEMIPWLPLARWELLVDGVPFATVDFGAVGPSGGEGQGISGWQGADLLDFGALCESAQVDAGSDTIGWASPGAHTVQIVAHVDGWSAPVTTNALTVNVVCTPFVPPVEAPFDAGPPPASLPDGGRAPPVTDAGTTLPGSDGGAPENGAAPPSGCSTAPLASPWLMLLALRHALRRPLARRSSQS